MRIDIKRICVPTDFSEASDHAVHYGAALARHHGAELHLLHILENADALVHHPDFSADGEVALAFFRKLEETGVVVPTADDVKQAFVEAASGESEEVERIEEPAEIPKAVKKEDQYLVVHQFLKSLESGATAQLDAATGDWWQDLVVERLTRIGQPADAICHYANQNAVDLIVIATHGRRGLTRWMMGSVTERVMRASPCPVLTVRHPDHKYTLVE